MPIVRKFEVDYFYHVYSRGVNKEPIFFNQSDYERFVKSIFYFNSDKNKKMHMDYVYSNKDEEEIVHIEAFCLMPNHYHFLLKEIKKGGISKFMQKLNTAYTMYFNRRYSRTGALLGGTFRDKIVETDFYLMYLKSYISNNPLKIIRPDYDSKDLLYERIKLTEEEKSFLNQYPYKYQV